MAGLAESTYALACGGREQRVAVSRRRQLHSAPTRARRARSGGGEEQLRLTTGRGLPESCRSSTGGYALLGLAGSEAQLTGSVEEGSVRRVVDTRAELLPIQCQRPGLRLPCRFKALGALTKSVAAAESYTLRGHPDPRSCHLGGGFDERSSVIIATHTRREKPCTAPATSMAARHPTETPTTNASCMARELRAAAKAKQPTHRMGTHGVDTHPSAHSRKLAAPNLRLCGGDRRTARNATLLLRRPATRASATPRAPTACAPGSHVKRSADTIIGSAGGSAGSGVAASVDS